LFCYYSAMPWYVVVWCGVVQRNTHLFEA
jgi:hypothetical protein